VKNLSEVLSAEAAGTATRWELPLFGVSGSEAAAAVIGRQLHTAEHLDALEQSAYQEGLQRGHAEGYVAGLREAQAQAARIQALLDCMRHPFRDFSTNVERALLELTMDAARKLINVELELDPAKVTAAVQEGVTALAAMPHELRVHLHPQDAQLLRETLTLNTEAEWKIVADTTLQRGDCRIVTDAGRVDARLDTRQASISRTLLGDDA
jgi:flagellar assembly protein FliH